MTASVSFESLTSTDLVVGATYQGGTSGTVAVDPLARILPWGNQGGFRVRGSARARDYRIALLYTSGGDPDWPDSLDAETGLFTYFGDNKLPGRELHDTQRGGNDLLRFCFDRVHGAAPDRSQVPPFFVFKKAHHGPGRDVEFVGLAVPGGLDVPPLEDLVAVWRTKDGQRFQNYQATFTVLDVPTVPRQWIGDLERGERLTSNCPKAYRSWVESGMYRPLAAARALQYRTPREQLPDSEGDRALINVVYEHFSPDPYRFEACAIALWKMLAKESVTVTATRPTRDSGRDAYGTYSLGPAGDRIHLDFSLEAKCYRLGHGCGVRDTARLISRLRHRQFGVFVTTSYVGPASYKEIREDGHPVVVLAARDIIELLKQQRLASVPVLREWLTANFPMAPRHRTL